MLFRSLLAGVVSRDVAFNLTFQAVQQYGEVRGKLAKSVMDCGEGLPPIWQRTMEQELEQQVADIEKYHNTADGRVQVWFGLRTIFNNTDELCVRTKELADKYGVGIHMHVAEAKEEKEYTYARWGEGTVKQDRKSVV